jgi:hypothetical protein
MTEELLPCPMLDEAYRLLDASRTLIMMLEDDRFRFVEERKVQELLDKIHDWTGAYVFKEPGAPDLETLKQEAARDLSEQIIIARNNTLIAAINLCEAFVQTNGTATQCKAALSDLLKSMNEIRPAPSQGN